MLVLKLKKEIRAEEGYLLLENLVTLTVLMAILIMLYPLIVDWLVARDEAKSEVELSRVLYETTTNWPDYLETGYPFKIKSSEDSVSIQSPQKVIEVKIIEAKFEE